MRFYGEPDGLQTIPRQALIDAIERVKPAHLQFIITAVTWGDLETFYATWDDLDAEGLTWEQLESKVAVYKSEEKE